MAKLPDNCASSAGAHTAEDFSFLIWHHIFVTIVENEKNASATGKTICFEVEVAQRTAQTRNSIIELELICEPGKPARPLAIRSA